MASPEGQALIERLARAVRDVVLFRSLPLSALHKDPFGPASDSDLLNELRSELSVFILENAASLEPYITGGDRHFAAYVKQRFLSWWLTVSRTPARDPSRYLYKRTQDVIRKEEGFFTQVRKGRSTLYSIYEQNRAIPGLTEEDLRSVPLPPEHKGNGDYQAVKARSTLVKLAAYFWQEIYRMWQNGPIWVAIQDFIDWMGLHVSLKRVFRENGLFQDGSGFEEFIASAQGVDEQSWDPEAVESWASNFFYQVSPKALHMFQLFHQAKWTLREIAQEMGYQGSSGPKYVVDQITRKLQFFLRDLPWLSPDDLSEDAFSHFFDMLFSLLKKDVSKP